MSNENSEYKLGGLEDDGEFVEEEERGGIGEVYMEEEEREERRIMRSISHSRASEEDDDDRMDEETRRKRNTFSPSRSIHRDEDEEEEKQSNNVPQSKNHLEHEEEEGTGIINRKNGRNLVKKKKKKNSDDDELVIGQTDGEEEEEGNEIKGGEENIKSSRENNTAKNDKIKTKGKLEREKEEGIIKKGGIRQKRNSAYMSNDNEEDSIIHNDYNNDHDDALLPTPNTNIANNSMNSSDTMMENKNIKKKITKTNDEVYGSCEEARRMEDDEGRPYSTALQRKVLGVLHGNTFSIILTNEDAAFVLGKNGNTKRKIAKVSGAFLDLQDDGLRLDITGNEEEREKAILYVKLIMRQRVGPVQLDFPYEDRDDLTIVCIPHISVGYVTGAHGSVLRRIEDEWGILMFFVGHPSYNSNNKDNKKDKKKVKKENNDNDEENSKIKEGSECDEKEEERNEEEDASSSSTHLADEFQHLEKLLIFGPPVGRRGAELKIMSAVEQKCNGFFTSKITEEYVNDYDEGFLTEYVCIPQRDFSYALGKEGKARKKLCKASGCILEYVGKVAFIAGTLEERRRVRDYLSWLIKQRYGNIHIPDLHRRNDVTMVHVDSDYVGHVTGRNGAVLRDIEDKTNTYCFFYPQTNRHNIARNNAQEISNEKGNHLLGSLEKAQDKNVFLLRNNEEETEKRKEDERKRKKNDIDDSYRIEEEYRQRKGKETLLIFSYDEEGRAKAESIVQDIVLHRQHQQQFYRGRSVSRSPESISYGGNQNPRYGYGGNFNMSNPLRMQRRYHPYNQFLPRTQFMKNKNYFMGGEGGDMGGYSNMPPAAHAYYRRNGNMYPPHRNSRGPNNMPLYNNNAYNNNSGDIPGRYRPNQNYYGGNEEFSYGSQHPPHAGLLSRGGGGSAAPYYSDNNTMYMKDRYAPNNSASASSNAYYSNNSLRYNNNMGGNFGGPKKYPYHQMRPTHTHSTSSAAHHARLLSLSPPPDRPLFAHNAYGRGGAFVYEKEGGFGGEGYANIKEEYAGSNRRGDGRREKYDVYREGDRRHFRRNLSLEREEEDSESVYDHEKKYKHEKVKATKGEKGGRIRRSVRDEEDYSDSESSRSVGRKKYKTSVYEHRIEDEKQERAHAAAAGAVHTRPPPSKYAPAPLIGYRAYNNNHGGGLLSNPPDMPRKAGMAGGRGGSPPRFYEGMNAYEEHGPGGGGGVTHKASRKEKGERGGGGGRHRDVSVDSYERDAYTSGNIPHYHHHDKNVKVSKRKGTFEVGEGIDRREEGRGLERPGGGGEDFYSSKKDYAPSRSPSLRHAISKRSKSLSRSRSERRQRKLKKSERKKK